MKNRYFVVLSIVSFINKYLRKLNRNLVFDAFTGKDKLLNLIKLLSPYNTDKELIRLGETQFDGGYLLPNDLDGIQSCFSPGVGLKYDFEKDCLERGMSVYAIDKSVDKPNINSEKYKFEKKFLGANTRECFITLEDWVLENDINPDKDLLLQIDIDGPEYISLLSTPQSIINRFRIVVIELHFLPRLFDDVFYPYIYETIYKLTKNHTCVHIHPNNCCGIEKFGEIEIPREMEFTLLRNDRIKWKERNYTFPHKLDQDSTCNKHMGLPKIWYEH